MGRRREFKEVKEVRELKKRRGNVYGICYAVAIITYGGRV